MKFVSSIVGLCLIATTFVVAQNPGFMVAITNTGLDYIRQVGLPILEKELLTINIPDINGDAGTPVGHISYSLSQIKVQNIQIPNSVIQVNPSGLAVAISSVSISMTSHWHYREDSFPHISDSGSADISASSISATVTVDLGMNPTTHEPTITNTNCNAGIGSLHITFHGGASWLYNLFDSVIADQVKKSLNSELCRIINQEIVSEGNKALASLPTQEKIDSHALINFELVNPPEFTTDFVLTRHKGEFFQINNPSEAPFSPAPIPLPAPGTLKRMMYVWISPYLLQTAGFVYMNAGVLQYTLTNADIPASFPFKLNTSSLGILIPQLQKMYPDMAMNMLIEAIGAPIVPVLTPNGFNATITLSVTAGVILPNQTVTQVFSVNTTVLAAGKVIVAQGATPVVSANLTFLQVGLVLSWSKVGDFPVSVLQSVFNVLCDDLVIPALNKKLNAGFPIPTVDGMSLVNPEVTFGDNYVLIDTDIHYAPSYWNITTKA